MRPATDGRGFMTKGAIGARRSARHDMPATEQTWRELKLMHVIFGLSSLAMLGTTVWMLYADYSRGWKGYQAISQRVDTWYTKARITETQNAEFEAARREKAADLERAVAKVPPRKLLDQFLDELAGHASEGEIEAIRASHSQLAANPTAEGRTALLEELQGFIRQARFDEDDLAQERKFARADLDVARSEYELGVGQGLPADRLATLQSHVGEIQAKVDRLTADYEEATTHRKKLEAVLGQMTADEAAARKALADQESALEQMLKAHEAQTDPLRNVLTLPIVDAFNSPLEIDNRWLPKLTINYNFSDVPRWQVVQRS
jgi:hypothetical protein